MKVNVDGVIMWCAKAAGTHFRRQKKEKITIDGRPRDNLISGKSLAVEWTGFARSNCISPGYINTDIAVEGPQEVKKLWKDKTPMGFQHPPPLLINPDYGHSANYQCRCGRQTVDYEQSAPRWCINRSGENHSSNEIVNDALTLSQDFTPVKNICAHLNAFHAYASDPSRNVEANHYCGHLNEDVRQCIIYDSAEPNARIIGIEYMITPALYETLDAEERKLWHSHVYEVKSGMLVMPQARLPSAVWDIAENKEMEQVVRLYGKTYHLWQVDRGDKLPLGKPELMISYIADGQIGEDVLKDRDLKFGVDHQQKKKNREYIEEPPVHPDADQAWKST
ncbi:hypothetical protein jhhlp_008557 [Lomentospora prolificans]|uniref:DUF1264 domain-containing protein n=1 Tax=Lomentospora prolificans TaxID=41688 RepID=A0A2N3MYD1_9PEZI|nr:hypothetical protein jhhlp_008557 [Lomentospora prolificans]